MDWRQLIIDHPALAMATVLPLFLFAAAVKIGITLSTGWDAPVDDDETKEDAGPDARIAS
ncbi:MAG: hypothetical protein H6736_19820 [Alphaproteobacteria bacterium]|nr:hypothetical protein [Alphaproteobacteria bacterium]MCB9694062.1 hypothetical protein [Alphaproteobacteria bacterium]